MTSFPRAGVEIAPDGTVDDSERQQRIEAERSERVDEFYTGLEDIGMGDVEFEHARQANVALAQRGAYFVDGGFWAVTMEREREYTERISGYQLPGDGLTYVLLIRSGDKDEGNGRTYYIGQHADLVDDLPRLVEEYGFEFTDIRSRDLKDELPDEYTDEYTASEGSGDGESEWKSG